LSTTPGPDIEPLAVACPACGASADQLCTQTTNTGRRPVDWVHNARKDLADGWT
jgi:hypothetical protein